MKSNEILYSKGGNDECHTPEYAVTALLPLLPKDVVVWCPFDKGYSNYVQVLRKAGYKVIHSHIDDGKDFMQYQPNEHWDIIVSNPPFTNKRKIFERALSFGKPFALLMSITWLNDTAPYQIFAGKRLQFVFLDKRTDFYELKDGVMVDREKKITFNSSYFCYDLLAKDVNIVTVNK